MKQRLVLLIGGLIAVVLAVVSPVTAGADGNNAAAASAQPVTVLVALPASPVMPTRPVNLASKPRPRKKGATAEGDLVTTAIELHRCPPTGDANVTLANSERLYRQGAC